MQIGMEQHVGIYRDQQTLKEGIRIINELKDRARNVSVEDQDHVYNTDLVSALELEFMLDVAETMPYAALLREESRGAHYRTDFEQRDDERFLKHSMAYRSGYEPRITYTPVTITRWKPEKRVY
jgi:succinate dehydrogenase/fumarate reductase flavoprotein subunit